MNRNGRPRQLLDPGYVENSVGPEYRGGAVQLVGCPVAAKIGGRDRCIIVVEQGAPVSAGIIAHCVWLYHRFPLSFREVEELMLQRGVVVSYETIRLWCAKFGQAYANQLRGPRPGDKWHLDEVFIRINSTTHYLWRAVDQNGAVLDVLVQSRRNALAAKKFFRNLLRGQQYVPRVLVTDKLASYQAAHRELLPSVEHRRSNYLNNRLQRTPINRPVSESGR